MASFPKIFPENSRPASQFFQLLMYMVVGFGLMSLLAVLLGILIWDIDFAGGGLSIDDDLTASQIGFLKVLQFANSIGLFVVPPLLAFWLSKRGEFELGLFPLPSFKLIAVSGGIMLLLLPMINVLVFWNENLSLPESLSSVELWMRESEARAKHITEVFLKMESVTDLLINLGLIALIPALGEELLFRGGLQGIFSRLFKNAHLGIWLAAFVFSAFHLQFFGFFPRLLLGVLFGYLLLYSGSIWLPVVAHFVNNALAVTVHFLIQKGLVDSSVDEVGVNEPYFLPAIGGTILAFLLFKQFIITTNMGIKKEA